MKIEKNKAIAYSILRVTMGINIICHGLVRIPKIDTFRQWVVTEFQATVLPYWAVYAWGSVLPFVETLIGLFLILGLFTRKAAIAGGIVIAILMLGSCLNEKWEWAGIQIVYALLYYMLISHVDQNTFAIDNIFKNKKS